VEAPSPAPDSSRQTLERPPVGASSGPLRVARTHWKLLVTAAIALLLAGGVLWWRTERAAPEKYITVKPTRGDIAHSVTATGTVNPVLTVIVGSYVSGVIQDMYCDYNTRVHKGQLCAMIDPRPYQAALDQAKGQLARDMAQLEAARLDLARYGTLVGQDSIAKQTYDDQGALVHQLMGTVQLDRALVETATVNLGYTNIVSPVNGTVVARNITIGQTVAASFQTPTLFLIATDLTKMQVDTNVSESDIGAVSAGNQARFSVEAFPDRFFHGAVAEVRQAPQTVQNVVTYDVVVGAENPDFALKPGMTANVVIITEQHPDVLRVPDQALRFSPSHAPSLVRGSEAGQEKGRPATTGASGARAGEGGRVWVLRDGKVVPVPVTTGLDDDTYTEIVRGELSDRDDVIVGELAAGSGSANLAAPGFFRSGR